MSAPALKGRRTPAGETPALPVNRPVDGCVARLCLPWAWSKGQPCLSHRRPARRRPLQGRVAQSPAATFGPLSDAWQTCDPSRAGGRGSDGAGGPPRQVERPNRRL